MPTEKKSRKPISDATGRQCNQCKEFRPWSFFRNKKWGHFNKWSICKDCYKWNYCFEKHAIQSNINADISTETKENQLDLDAAASLEITKKINLFIAIVLFLFLATLVSIFLLSL